MPAPWQDCCGAPPQKGKAQGAGRERAPEGALLCHQYLQSLPLEPRARRAWRGGPQRTERRLLSPCDVWKVCSLTLLTGQNSVTVIAATLCGVSLGARSWLCVLLISNSLGVAWSGGTGMETQVSLTAKLPSSSLHSPFLCQHSPPSPQRLFIFPAAVGTLKQVQRPRPGAWPHNGPGASKTATQGGGHWKRHGN